MQNFYQISSQFLDRIPATFWGVVIGSLFTLTGTYFTNRAGDRRQKEQLQNDRESNAREREMTFKKDTYAAAAEAISISITALAKLSDLSFSLKEISALYLDKSPVLAKVNLVAGEETLRTLTSFGTEFGSAFLRLTQQRMILSILQEQIVVKAKLVEGFEKTRDAMIELMRHHNIDGIQDSRRFEAIQENYEFEAGRIATANQEIQQMVAELYAKHNPFAKECFNQSARITQLVIPLLVSARMELDLSISKERYTEILRHTEILSQAQSKLGGQLDEFIQNVATTVNAEAPAS